MMMQTTSPPNISMALPSSTRGDEGIIEGNLKIINILY